MLRGFTRVVVVGLALVGAVSLLLAVEEMRRFLDGEGEAPAPSRHEHGGPR